MVGEAEESSDRQSIENPFWFAAGVRAGQAPLGRTLAAQANVGTGTISHSLVTRLVTS
jgi:hypothetical protein